MRLVPMGSMERANRKVGTLMAEKLAQHSAHPRDELAERITELFFVRLDAHGVEMLQGWITVKQPVTLELVQQHLRGGPCLGAHPISADDRCRWIGWDLDAKEKADLVYSRAVAKYPKSSVLLNSTGGRGYHIRVFFNRSIPAADAHRLAKELTQGMEEVECYPKQASIGVEGLGNFMRLPLGRHRKTDRTGTLIFPQSLLEIKPCAPPVPPTFKQLAEQCQHRVEEAKMDNQGRVLKLDVYDCLFSNGTVGSCREEQCPILLRQDQLKGEM